MNGKNYLSLITALAFLLTVGFLKLTKFFHKEVRLWNLRFHNH
jgi:hypothetical protein